MAELTSLEIIGYGDVLNDELVPRRIPPVYRVKGTDEILFPPFRVDGSQIEGGGGTVAEFESEVDLDQATKLAAAIPALPGHDLWIDDQFNPHYGPRAEVTNTLRTEALERVRRARSAIKDGDLEAGLLLAQQALAADEDNFNAIVVKAHIFELQGDKGQVEGLRRLARDARPDLDFDYEMAQLTERSAARSTRIVRTTIDFELLRKALQIREEDLEPCPIGL